MNDPDPIVDSPPWRFLTVKGAAKLLSVDRELIEGIANGKKIRSVRVSGKTGTSVLMVNRDDINDLRAKMARVNDTPKRR